MALSELAAKYEALGERFDGLYHGLTPAVRNAIQKTLAEWQDYYYGSEASESQSTVWKNLFDKAQSMLNQAAALGVKHTVTLNAQPMATAKLGVTYITGAGSADPFASYNFPQPKWYWLALPMVPALYMMFRSRR